MLTLRVFYIWKAFCWFPAFQGFCFLPKNTFENLESTESFILTVFWGEIFPRHDLLMSLLVWLCVWSLLWIFLLFLWLLAFLAIPGNQPSPSFPIGLVKTESGFIVRSVETDLGRWMLVIAVIGVYAYSFLVFADLTCHLEDAIISVFWLHCAAW